MNVMLGFIKFFFIWQLLETFWENAELASVWNRQKQIPICISLHAYPSYSLQQHTPFIYLNENLLKLKSLSFVELAQNFPIK